MHNLHITCKRYIVLSFCSGASFVVNQPTKRINRRDKVIRLELNAAGCNGLWLPLQGTPKQNPCVRVRVRVHEYLSVHLRVYVRIMPMRHRQCFIHRVCAATRSADQTKSAQKGDGAAECDLGRQKLKKKQQHAPSYSSHLLARWRKESSARIWEPAAPRMSCPSSAERCKSLSGNPPSAVTPPISTPSLLAAVAVNVTA